MAMPYDQDARKYYRVAKQRLDEAQLVVERLQLFRVAVYIGGYAAECILKALLLSVTPERERPATMVSLRREFGHSVLALGEGLRQRGVNVPGRVAREIAFAASWSPELRYEPGLGDPRETGRFLAAVEVVLLWADGSM